MPNSTNKLADRLADKKAREQVLDTTKSFIVQAGAGAGKTSLLIDRYLALLALCAMPENVLVITFTNKAVDELRTRVLAILRLADEQKNATKENKQTAFTSAHHKKTHLLAQSVCKRSEKLTWSLLSHPERLKIMTIDALSLVIVKFHSSDIFHDILSEAEQNICYKRSVNEVLTLIDDVDYGVDIQTTLSHLDNDTHKFCRLISKMLAKRDQWLRHIHHIDVFQNTSRAIIQAHLLQLVTGCQNLASDFWELVCISPKLSYATKKFFSIFTHADNLKNQENLYTPESLVHWHALSEICLTQRGQWRKTNLLALSKKDGFDLEIAKLKIIMPSLLEDLKLAQLLFEVHVLPDIILNSDDTHIAEVLRRVLKLSVAQLRINFTQMQALDFIEIAMAAVSLLKAKEAPSEVSLYMDYQVQHILFDEFQDTSYTQFELLKSLISTWQNDDGRTLFLVGDPMQSIYGFREAQVGLFLKVWQSGIFDMTLTPLRLSVNFRSTTHIVEKNNDLFQSIFPKVGDILTGAICYYPSNANSDLSNIHSKAITENSVVFYAYKNRKDSVEAEQVVRIVRDELAFDCEQEIAILVRSRSHVSEIMVMLSAQNICFEAVDIKLLGAHFIIKDLLSLLKAISHLGDKLSWLSILRAPWCGLLLADLLLISDETYPSIWAAINDHEKQKALTKDGRERVLLMCDILAPILAQVRRFSFATLLASAISRLGFNLYASAHEKILAEQFLDLVSQCETADGKIDMEVLHLRLDKTYLASEKANVKLMTIYGAKGLEFDTVIMPGLGKVAGTDKKEVFKFKEFDPGLLYAPIKNIALQEQSATYQYLSYIENKQSDYELRRVLYVAMTRAKRKIYLLAHQSAQAKNPQKRTLLYYLWQHYKPYFDALPEEVEIEKIRTAPPFYRYKKMNEVSNRKITKTKKITPLDQNLKPLYQKILGTVTHLCLEQNTSPNQQVIRARLTAAGIPVKNLDDSVEKLLLFLNHIKTDKKAHWIFSKRESTRTEAEFFTQDGTNIIIDRLFIENGVLWVIDYKTHMLKADETLAHFLTRQKTKHQTQMQKYQSILARYYNYPIKTALYLVAIPYLLEL